MDTYLLDLPVNQLLIKFGAGEHKPGSGSAAALQGMLSAQLIQTVIALTLDPKRQDRYKKWIDDLQAAKSEIHDRIHPRLEKLFQMDSTHFDKAIKLRTKRDAEEDRVEKKKLTEEALAALIPATEIPVEIALICGELAEYSALIFDVGFKSARGDSGVAMSCAISAMSGCLSIIDLNLLSFVPNEWSKNIESQVKRIRKKYNVLSIKREESFNRLREEVNQNAQFYEQIGIFKDKNMAGTISSNADIEHLTVHLQRIVWKYRNKIWLNNAPKNPLELLNPEVIINIVGYEFNKDTTLGQHSVNGNLFEVAGLIDNNDKKISISEQFPIETQRFTAAHELGHAILHEQSVLHRDRGLDGSLNLPIRDKNEKQADKFATYFLMPKKQVAKKFTTIFLTDRFLIDDSTAFALFSGSVDDLKRECRDLRSLSRKLASTEYYNAVRFPSMAQQFNVSVEAMAIRLEELELLSY